MGRTSIGRQAFEPARTQLVSPTCRVISSAVFTNSFAVGLAMESFVLTNLFAVVRLAPSLLFEDLCFVRMVIGSLSLPNSLPVWLSLAVVVRIVLEHTPFPL